MQKRFAPIATAAAIALIAAFQIQAENVPEPAGWKLDWHDEFDGPEIEPANWTYDLGGGGWGNGEYEAYTRRPENARIEGGQLMIEVRHEYFQGQYYSSARLKTQGLRTFEYGRIEARIKLPSGAGLWPAFWLLGSDIGTRGWPACGEIDVMEYVGRDPSSLYGTAHGPGYSGAGGLGGKLRVEGDLAGDYHVFAVEWEPESIRWFCDGKEYFALSPDSLGGRKWVFDHPFFVILNLAVGGGFAGNVAPDTSFPARMLVDYVRAYRKAEL
jgi:beta-glucanase (GH16 family)